MKDIIRNAFIEMLSGIARYHKDGGVIAEDNSGNRITLYFPTKSFNYVIERAYYNTGEKWWEIEYKNGLRHGRNIGWYRDGNIKWEVLCENGKTIGIKEY